MALKTVDIKGVAYYTLANYRKKLSDEQMKGIYQKNQMLELVTNYAEVINIIGKPIIKKLLGFVKSI